MSDEDMTCLFCGRGGVRAAVIDEVTDPGCDIANVPIYATSCPHCGARGPMALSEDEALAAWNRRAEHTCRNLNPPSCRDFECSECGESSEFTPGFMPNYCPHCGARVEEASDDADR